MLLSPDSPLPIAIIQAAPVYLEREASLQKALRLIEQAADQGAKLVVFGESWLGGYPAWLDHCPDIARWNEPATKAVFARMHQSAVCVPGPEVTALAQAARTQQVSLVMGLNERVDSGPGQGTLYNSLLFFSTEGELLNHHRKLMPTFTEKLVYGMGDGQGLTSVDTSWGKLGGLICWEHWMPHARQALHEAGETVHVAVWPTVDEMHQLASRHYAFEGRCFVLAAGQLLQVKDLPSELRLPPELADQPEAFLLKGGSCVIGPDGKYLVEPVFEQETILMAELPLQRVLEERMTLDVSGHYQRADVFDFRVNRKRKS